MEPVALVEEGGVEAVGLGGIGDEAVEVDHAVEDAACADPFIQGDAPGLMVRGVVAVALDGRDGGAEDLDAPFVGLLDDPGPYFLDTLGGGLRVAAAAQVVRALEEDDVLDAGMAEEVADVAALARGAETAAEDAVAAQAEVQHGEVPRGGIREEGLRELVRPAVLAVRRRAAAVGDGITQDGDRGALPARLHVDGTDGVPMVRLRDWRGEVRGVAVGDVGRGPGARMAREEGR